jgi:regulator of RNase E activity RraB
VLTLCAGKEREIQRQQGIMCQKVMSQTNTEATVLDARQKETAAALAAQKAKLAALETRANEVEARFNEVRATTCAGS